MRETELRLVNRNAQILAKHREGAPAKALAKEFGMSHQAILFMISTANRWKKINESADKLYDARRKKATSCSVCKKPLEECWCLEECEAPPLQREVYGGSV